MPVVVVLPCAPETTTVSRRLTSSARNAALVTPSTRSAYAVETTISQPSGTTGSGAITSSCSRNASRYAVSTRSQPPPSAPHADAIAAYAERPAPPIPTNQRRRPSSGGKLDQLFRDDARGIGLRERAHAIGHPRE